MTWVSFSRLIAIFDNDMNAVSTFMQDRYLHEHLRSDRDTEDYYPLAEWGVDAWWDGTGLQIGTAYSADELGYNRVPKEEWDQLMIPIDMLDLLGV